MSIFTFKYSFFSVIEAIYVSFHRVLFDSPRQGQLIFQRPATQTMEQLTDLHHDIFSLLLFLCIIVFYLLVQLVYKFRATNFETPRNFFFKAHTILEIF